MGIETASFISGLNSSWPLGTDSGTLGDNHLRLIKSVLKGTFPGAGGNGFSKQIIATEDELNHLHGLNADIMTLIGNATFPAGTVLPFYNASPPTGWSLVSQPSTRMLVVGGSTGHTSAGTDDPLLNNKVPTHNHTASGGTTDSAGSHSHSFSPGQTLEVIVGGAGNIFGGAGNVQVATASISTAGDHTHTLSSLTIDSNAGGSNWSPRYLGLILCSKN